MWPRVYACVCVKRYQPDVIIERARIFVFVLSHDNASATWCSISARCTTSKSNSDNSRCHRARRLVEFAKLRVSFSAPLTVRRVNQWPFK